MSRGIPSHIADWANLHDLGLIVNDRETAERLIRVVGALIFLHDRHGFDEAGRCRRCRPVRRWMWQRRHPCIVHEALAELGINQTGVEMSR